MARVTFKLLRPLDKNGDEKTTKVAIICCYNHQGLRVENISLGIYCKPANWKGERVKAMPRKEKINKFLTALEQDLLNVHIDYRHVTLKERESIIRSLMKGDNKKTGKPTSIVTLYRFMIQYKREYTKGTIARYKELAKKLKKFLRGERLDFSLIDNDFFERFKNFLYDFPNKNYKGYHLDYSMDAKLWVIKKGEPKRGFPHVGLFDEIVFTQLISLRKVCKWLDDDRGYVVHPAYKKIKIIKRKHEPIALELNELQKIERLNLTGELALARDYFVIACRTGQRIGDIKNITMDNIKNDQLELIQLKGNRLKRKPIKLRLGGFSRNALLILQSYNFKLPRLSLRQLNINIKLICEQAGIKKQMFIDRWQGGKCIRYYGPKYEFFSIHNGKKTFITLCLGQGIPMEVLSAVTGTNRRTLDTYYKGEMDNEQVQSYFKNSDENDLMSIAN